MTRRPDDATLRNYQLGRLTPAGMAAVERWLEDMPGAVDELIRVVARDRFVDALIDTNALDTPRAPGVRPAPAADVPARLDWFATVRELGRGGMGIVLESHDTKLGRRVAVKVISSQFAADAAIRDRFMREARAVAQIDHPNVVPVLQVGESGGTPYLVMPLLKGETLDARLRREGRLSAADVKRIGGEIAAGLSAAHAAGLVHRDIKPGNVWLDEGTGRARVLDFGLAKPLEGADADAPLTRAGAVLGTPHYMAPEQAAGRSTDLRADLFSLGVVLYQMATGERPFTGETVFAVIAAVTAHTPPPPVELNPHLPAELSRVIDELLAKDASARPPSAAAVVTRLSQPDLPPVVPAADASPWAAIDATAVDEYVDERPEPKRPRSRRGAWAAVAVAACVLIAGVVVIVRDRNGKEVARVPLPEGGSAGLEPAKPGAPTTSADRKAAEYVLSLGGTVRVNGENRDITAAADLPNEVFTLRWADLSYKKVTDAGMASFKGCKRLQYLNMHDARISDTALANFNGCRELVYIDLYRTGVTDAGFAHFKGNENVRWLDLSENRGITDAGLSHLSGTKTVSHLQLYGTDITDAALGYFKDCDNLMLLNVGNTRITNSGLALFKDRKNVMSLNLSHTAVTDDGLSNFRGCRSLHEIYLAVTKVTKAGVLPFTTRKGWAHIDIQQTNFSAADVAELTEAAPQWTIAYGGATIDPENAVQPDRRAAEWALFVGGGVRVHGDGREIQTAADLPTTGFRLTAVDLHQTALFRGPELKLLKGCAHLRSLDASNTAVTDTGLPHLKDCVNLVELNFQKTKVTRAGVTDLATTLPQCRIAWDGGVIEPKAR